MGLHRFSEGIKDRNPVDFCPSLAGGHACHNLCPILHHPLGMEGSKSPGDSLGDDPRILIDEYTHSVFSPRAMTLRTASSISDS